MVNPPGRTLADDEDRWKLIRRYAYTSALDKSSVVVNGKDMNDRATDCEYIDGPVDAESAEDFTHKHSWTSMPS